MPQNRIPLKGCFLSLRHGKVPKKLCRTGRVKHGFLYFDKADGRQYNASV